MVYGQCVAGKTQDDTGQLQYKRAMDMTTDINTQVQNVAALIERMVDLINESMGHANASSDTGQLQYKRAYIRQCVHAVQVFIQIAGDENC